MKCKNCNHEARYHAIPENHVLGTSHCTFGECQCKEFVEEGSNEKNKEDAERGKGSPDSETSERKSMD